MLWETSLQFWETSRIPPKRGTGVKTEGVAKTPEDTIDGDETQVVDPIAPRKIMSLRSSLQVVPNLGNCTSSSSVAIIEAPNGLMLSWADL